MAIITISRGSFSGGKMLAEEVGKVLNYRVLSREVLISGAKKYGVSQDKLAEALETPPKFWDRFKHERRLYLSVIQAALCDEVIDNRVVYHGHAGHLLLKGLFPVIKVRVVAPVEFRLKLLMKTRSMKENEALRYIHKKDEERIRWTKFLYGMDWHDLSLYDIMINLENVEMDCAVDILMKLAGKKDSKMNEEYWQQLTDHCLNSHVRAALALNEATAAAEIDVSVKNGVVYLTGTVANEILVEKIIAQAQEVPGVKEINRDQFVGLER